MFNINSNDASISQSKKIEREKRKEERRKNLKGKREREREREGEREEHIPTELATFGTTAYKAKKSNNSGIFVINCLLLCAMKQFQQNANHSNV